MRRESRATSRRIIEAMRIEHLGESAYVLRDLSGPAYQVAKALESSAVPGLLDVVPSYTTVGVFLDGSAQGSPDFFRMLEALEVEGVQAVHHTIPVCYTMGPDMVEVCSQLALSPSEVANLHCSITYTCHAIGFCPGFPYLGYLPERLEGIPRRKDPRVVVEPGSVGITGDQTGIYPLPRPGGWALIGRTPLEIVNLQDGYFPISAGDQVQFEPIEEPEFRRLAGTRL
jgi:inhibitor of KinA